MKHNIPNIAGCSAKEAEKSLRHFALNIQMYGCSVKEGEKSLRHFAQNLRSIEKKDAISLPTLKLLLYQKRIQFFKNLL